MPDAREVLREGTNGNQIMAGKRVQTCSICRIYVMEANVCAGVKNHCIPPQARAKFPLVIRTRRLNWKFPKITVSAFSDWFCHDISWGWHTGNHKSVVHGLNLADFCKSAILFIGPSYFSLDKPACRSYTGNIAI